MCLSCSSVKVTPLLDRLIFASENLDTETIEVDLQNGFRPSVLCSSLSDFYCFLIFKAAYLKPREDFPGNSFLINRGVITCLLCASVKVTSLLDRLIFASKNLDTETIEVDCKMASFFQYYVGH